MKVRGSKTEARALERGSASGNRKFKASASKRMGHKQVGRPWLAMCHCSALAYEMPVLRVVCAAFPLFEPGSASSSRMIRVT